MTNEFSRTQRKLLSRLAAGPGTFVAFDATHLLLERKGLVRRRSGPKAGKLSATMVIEWEITPAGLAMLGRS